MTPEQEMINEALAAEFLSGEPNDWTNVRDTEQWEKPRAVEPAPSTPTIVRRDWKG